MEACGDDVVERDVVVYGIEALGIRNDEANIISA